MITEGMMSMMPGMGKMKDQMAAAGQGEPIAAFGTLVERIEMNMTDPSPDLPEGERATVQHPHPILTDERVRRALQRIGVSNG